jgi:hypothetical protein
MPIEYEHSTSKNRDRSSSPQRIELLFSHKLLERFWLNRVICIFRKTAVCFLAAKYLCDNACAISLLRYLYNCYYNLFGGDGIPETEES